MLCYRHIEILSNCLNKGSLYFHFALGHTNYAADHGQCVDAEKPCSRLWNRNIEMKISFLPTRIHNPAGEGNVCFLACMPERGNPRKGEPGPAWRARKGKVSLLLMFEEWVEDNHMDAGRRDKRGRGQIKKQMFKDARLWESRGCVRALGRKRETKV